MILFFNIVFILYFTLVALLAVNLKIRPVSRKYQGKGSKISIVVPFRNEEHVIGLLIRDLLQLDFSAGYFEVILVDDHSEDNTANAVSDLIAGKAHFRFIALPTEKHGKKNAISLGIAEASGEIIVTTDADCRVPSWWLSRIENFFQDGRQVMAMGGVKIEGGHDLFSGLQALEFSSLVGVSLATSEIGFPTMCNGANLAFRKSAFLAVKGYDGNLSIVSGDDEFLMRKMHRQFPGRVKFLKDSDAVVTTPPQASVIGFIQQRVRWAGKWRHNSSSVAGLLAIFIWIFHLGWMVLPWTVWAGWTDVRWFFLWVAMKILPEMVFLFRSTSFLRVAWNTFHFLVLQFLYSPYVVCIGMVSQFIPYEWKGRKAT